MVFLSVDAVNYKYLSYSQQFLNLNEKSLLIQNRKITQKSIIIE